MSFDRSEFLATFSDEAKDHLQKLNEGLLALENDPTNAEIIEEMFREGHTLKGAARMMSFDEIKEVAHCIEDIFGAIHNKKILLDQDLTTVLFESLDILSLILEEIGHGQDISAPWQDMVKKLHDIYAEYLDQDKKKKKKKKVTKSKKSKKNVSEVKKSKSPVKKKDSSETIESPEILIEDNLTFESVRNDLNEQDMLSDLARGSIQNEEKLKNQNKKDKTAPKKDSVMELEEYIKVSISKINKILNLVGEMVINKINSNEKIRSIKKISKLSRSSGRKISDLSTMLLNNPKIASLENYEDIKSTFSEIHANMHKTKEDLSKLLEAISIEIFHLDPIIDELQLRMKQIRMLPIKNLFETMPRLVRDVATAQKKQVNLIISGEDTELDKKVLESIKSSFIHLLRNSVDHGIESPEERRKAGKPVHGTINIRAFYKGGNAIIEIQDDGRGISVEKIKAKAIDKGLITKEDAKNLSDSDIINHIFAPGFSTAPIITDISGRGVGLDVVKNDIESLKGTILIETEINKGTTFILQLPLTVAIIQVLLVKCGTEIFAIPLLSINESIIVENDQIFTIENRLAIRLREQTIPIVNLSELINIPEQYKVKKKTQDDKNFIVIINSMDRLLGIKVDEILGEQEVFIKSLDKRLGKIKNISGATVLGNGQVIFILEVLDLFTSSRKITFHSSSSRTNDVGQTSEQVKVKSVKDKRADRNKKTILIVEDSLTTRELERSILESHGYSVDTAIDGIDAMNKIQVNNYDLVVSDINMPKMDGFELCKAIKKDPKTKDIPFIVISSLDHQDNKRKGIEAGAQAYIVKSVFDQGVLIDSIQRFIG